MSAKKKRKTTQRACSEAGRRLQACVNRQLLLKAKKRKSKRKSKKRKTSKR